MTAINTKNSWRSQVATNAEWQDRLDPDSPNKYFIVSCDNHASEPMDFLTSRLDKRYHDRVPRVQIDDDGTQWLITEGSDPQPVRIAPTREDLIPTAEDFETQEVISPYSKKMEDEDMIRAKAGFSLEQRVADQRTQGVDAEIVFGQKGTLAFATPDPEFAGQMTRAWNRWAHDTFSSDKSVMPMAMIAPATLDEAISEVQWAASNGFHGLWLPNRPIYNRLNQPRNTLEYCDKFFEPLWAAIAETGLPMVLHVSTGQDPRAVRGAGGAITNFVCHSMVTTMEPMVQMISSGVFERHPSLRLGTIESGIGWIAWLLQQMDYSYRAHHMWVRPVIPQEPSFYFKRNCFASFIEETEALEALVEAGLEDNIVWSNDYPHHEGSFPHTKAAIARQMGSLSETAREKVLGLNAAKFFNIER
ncbi:Amidohydrolase [Sphingobium herbicidovorans NBRC 16415]|uniref:Amidohydrolase n=1 Tax=Sphingobium herbicidovorans (strain ATCC 700291 / DSM 11019 / CCUG 56400 / KCTC 2939 / LMG 18315 / NBRC 16415 / MH) TaxID=1219045 RepID=A0A086PC14_SPHHM|nr:amidohydrolase family protein [Sphingobium herbicidovorans]KFG90932.1 Amidohydrolase [Sphingobium herbicidovorans NBRC 16415]